MDFTKYVFNSDDKKDFYFGLISDIHADSKNFDAESFHRDCTEYKRKGARLFINGDVFDAILPTDRKRYTRADDDIGEDAQINKRIDVAFEVLKPYVNYIDFIGVGNHEASIVKYDHVDLIKILCRELNLIRDKELPPIQRGSYQGFLRLQFIGRDGKDSRSFDIYRDHGKGGAAPVTKGTINIQRLHTTFIADLYWLGHSHTGIVDTTPWTIYPNAAGRIVEKKKRSVITAGYHKSFQQRDLTGDALYRSSFPEERFFVPGGIGSALLHITVPTSTHDIEVEARIES